MPAVVTFDPIALRIVEISTGGDNELDWIEIYSEWKVWAALTDNIKYLPAFSVVGGEPISLSQNLGSTFFLNYPWKFRPAELSHRLVINGNLFTSPAGASPFVPTLGAYSVLAESKVSNLVDDPPSDIDIATAVWQTVLSGVITTATAEEMLSRITLPTAIPITSAAVVADGSNTSSSFKTDLTDSPNDYWRDALVTFATGPLAGQVKKVLAYNSATGFLTVGPSPGFTGAPVAGNVFVLVNR